jgi:hypothetical protein
MVLKSLEVLNATMQPFPQVWHMKNELPGLSRRLAVVNKTVGKAIMMQTKDRRRRISREVGETGQ